ncbi:MAG: UDP-glucose 6-dehydrogenase [Candidatus Diapherotrites archaeon CG11_big_fil_rev_8_21_14_0_20_37_9]|nr:MAG: UDP-glucose 6-dehydrogenase [Candidatus Diapherotrites archaeon CG11_big_fil_rev_8_21_14_0_20_37_9]
MKIAVIGTGYVGLVAGACLADLGNQVICVDIDESKITSLEKGIIPIYEPGLEEVVKRNVLEKRLSFTTDSAKAISDSKIIFIAVGTPQGDDGKAELKYVYAVAETIGKNANEPKIIVDKSTVPVGTSRKVKELAEKFSEHRIEVVSNPEFLREGSAVKDFLEPDRVVIGSDNSEAAKAIEDLYKPLGKEILITNPESAELIKYASNAFLATKISFINEIAAIADRVNADVSEVAKGMGLDARIGKQFLNAGCGYGGSCFPKDVKALQKIALDCGYKLDILREVEKVNEYQKMLPVEKLKKELGSLSGKKICVLGLAFKPNTDDMREASSIKIIHALVKEKAQVVAVDPIAEENAKQFLPKIHYEKSPYAAAKGCDAVMLVTEWNEFLELDFAKIGAEMNSKIIVDGRNAYDREKLVAMGFKYIGIGR